MADWTEGAAACAAALRARSVSAREVARACLIAIESRDPAIQAFTAVDGDRVEADARAVDEALARGVDPGPLCGVPAIVGGAVFRGGAPRGPIVCVEASAVRAPAAFFAVTETTRRLPTSLAVRA